MIVCVWLVKSVYLSETPSSYLQVKDDVVYL